MRGTKGVGLGRTLSVAMDLTPSIMCLKSQYESQGFLIVPCLIPPEIWTELEPACDLVISLTRSGSWKHPHTLGKQFPP